jgi:hypothetical protein
MDEVLNKFVKLNKSKWPNVRDSKNKILIEGFLSLPNHLIGVATIARAIYDVKKYEPIFLISKDSEESAEIKKIFKSYGLKKYITLRRGVFNIILLLKAFISTLKVYINNYNLDDFVGYELNNIIIGDLVYDSYIRRNNRYSNIKLWSFSFFKELLFAHIKFYLYNRLIKNYDFKYIVLGHRVYAEYGILARIAIKNNSKVIICRLTNVRCYHNYNEIFTNESKPSKELLDYITDKKLYRKVEKYLEKRFLGNLEQHDVINAYKNKKSYSREELCKELNLDPSYPIVFIMPHAFSDAPHSNRNMLFRDYYQWFIETIKYVNNIENINWVVKPHPSSYMYNEEGEVEQMLKKLKLDYIYLAPSDLSTASIFDIAKTIITACGTVGIEAACMGIRPIIAGKAPYSGFGITYEPKNKSEYFSILKKIYSVVPLNKQEMKIAKAIFYWNCIAAFPNSTIMPSKFVYPSPDIKVINKQKEEIYKMTIENLKNNDPKEDPYYLCIRNMIKENKKYLDCNII